MHFRKKKSACVGKKNLIEGGLHRRSLGYSFKQIRIKNQNISLKNRDSIYHAFTWYAQIIDSTPIKTTLRIFIFILLRKEMKYKHKIGQNTFKIDLENARTKQAGAGSGTLGSNRPLNKYQDSREITRGDLLHLGAPDLLQISPSLFLCLSFSRASTMFYVCAPFYWLHKHSSTLCLRLWLGALQGTIALLLLNLALAKRPRRPLWSYYL